MVNEIKDFILKWNLNYPVDKWWRDKYKIAFNSESHRVVSFVDMAIEYEEDQLFKSIKPVPYIPNSGDWWEHKQEDLSNLTDEEKVKKYKEEFGKLNLDDYDD